jgi:chromosome segregation ATPase
VDKTTLWSRVGDWVRNPRRTLKRDSFPVSEPASDDHSSNGRKRADGNREDSAPWYHFGGHRSRVLEIVLETRRVAELLESLRVQLERQTDDAQRANHTLDRLATSVARVPESMRVQTDGLASIQRRLDAEAADIRQIQEGLSKLVESKDAQNEVIASLARFTETSQTTGEILSAGLERIRQAVGLLDVSSSAALRSLDALRNDLRERGDAWTASLVGLNKRLLVFTTSAIALSLIALLTGVIALVR